MKLNVLHAINLKNKLQPKADKQGHAECAPRNRKSLEF